MPDFPPPRNRIVLWDLLGFLDFCFIDQLFKVAGMRAASGDVRPSVILEKEMNTISNRMLKCSSIVPESQN